LVTLILIFVCSYLAFSLSAICGGGAGLILIPILGGLLPVNQVPAALSIGTFTSSSSRIFAFYKSINWSIVKYFVPAALPAVWLGAWLLRYINPVYLEVAMGLFLISNLPFVLRKNKIVDSTKKQSKFLFILIGFLAGFLSGLTGVVGLLFNKFYLRHGLSKEEIVATRAANEVMLHLIKIVLYSLFGLISAKVILIGFIVAMSALLSTITMKFTLPRISEFVFKKIGYSAMVLSGVLMLSQSGQNIFFENKGAVSSSLISKGIETKLQWQNANYSLEFAYDEGFEFEQVIPFSDLSISQQQLVMSKQNDSDKIIIEIVYTMGDKYYEAYYFKNGKLLNKIEFK
jgi:uncharacterized protein